MPVECFVGQCQINTVLKKSFKTLTFVVATGLFDLTMQDCISTNMMPTLEKTYQVRALALLGYNRRACHTWAAMDRIGEGSGVAFGSLGNHSRHSLRGDVSNA